MGGHGGLNILPQKKWNVYNFDNREKVRLDEEAAAKEEQLKREQSRKRDSELRLEKLRQARGLATVASAVDPNKPSSPSSSSAPIQTLAPSDEKSKAPVAVTTEKPEAESRHINLFEGIRIFDPIKVGEEGKREEKKGKFWRESKKVKKEEVRAVGPEDEKYRVGYGVAGKGVKVPWYMEKKRAKNDGSGSEDSDDDDDRYDYDDVKSNKKRKAGGKKSLEELREERLKRESAEKQRERALIMGKSRRDVSAARDLGFSGRRR